MKDNLKAKFQSLAKNINIDLNDELVNSLIDSWHDIESHIAKLEKIDTTDTPLVNNFIQIDAKALFHDDCIELTDHKNALKTSNNTKDQFINLKNGVNDEI